MTGLTPCGRYQRPSREHENITIKSSNPALTSLAAQVGCLVATAIVAIQALRAGSRAESWDYAIYLAAAAIGAVSLARMLRRTPPTGEAPLCALLTVPILLLGIAGVERHPLINGLDLTPILWLGFGPWVMSLALLLLPTIFTIHRWEGLPVAVRGLLGAVAAAVCLLMLPAAWQGGASIIDIMHAEYTINENLAVAAGHLPHVDFVPQYGTLFSWLVAAVSPFSTPDGLVALSMHLMSAAAIAAVAIGVHLVHEGMQRRSIALAVLLVVPMTSLAPFPVREGFLGTIFALPGAVPTRIFPGMVIGMGLLALWGSGEPRSPIRRVAFHAALFLTGANLWHSLDFGGALLATTVVLLVILERDIARLAAGLASMLLGLLSYPLAGVLFGFAIDVSMFGAFLRGFGGGFNAEPITTPGPVLVILPMITTIAAISTGLLLRERVTDFRIPAHLRRAVVTAALFSVWAAMGFVYYLNRSYASGQMQILFLPLSVALGCFIHFVLQMDRAPGWSAKTFFAKGTWSGPALRRSLPQLVLAVLMALPLASTLAFPQPTVELRRLRGSIEGHVWPTPELDRLRAEAARLRASGLTDLAYFGESGHYLELATGVRSVNLFNSPLDLMTAHPFLERGCTHLIASEARFLLVDDAALALTAAFPDGRLCGVFAPAPALGPRVLSRG